MEKALFREKVDAMMPDLIDAIRKECSGLYDSGGIDTGKYQSEYILPKIILSVALESQPGQYRMFGQYKKETANLRHF